MTQQPSRYDDIADWYDEWAGEGVGLLDPVLPRTLDGQRILDLACGQGRLSRHLAHRGASVVAVDISAPLLAKARVRDEPSLGIEYLAADVSTAAEWWDGRLFDGVACDMALMDIDDVDGALATVHQVLAPLGWFVFSLFHPCFPGVRGDTPASWPPEHGYHAEGW